MCSIKLACAYSYQLGAHVDIKTPRKAVKTSF